MRYPAMSTSEDAVRSHDQVALCHQPLRCRQQPHHKPLIFMKGPVRRINDPGETSAPAATASTQQKPLVASAQIKSVGGTPRRERRNQACMSFRWYYPDQVLTVILRSRPLCSESRTPVMRAFQTKILTSVLCWQRTETNPTEPFIH